MQFYEIIKNMNNMNEYKASCPGNFTIINNIEDLWNCTNNGNTRIFVANSKANLNDELIDKLSEQIKGLRIIKSDIASCNINVAGILYEEEFTDICDATKEKSSNVKYMFGDLYIDSAANIYCRQNILQLSITEYKLLVFLINRPGQTATYEEIIKAVWQNDDEDFKIITDLVRRLRIKLENSGSKVCVVSLKKSGYYLEYMI